MTDPVTCPHCREQLDIPSEYRGRSVRCASCKNVFATPPLAGETAPPPATSTAARDEYDQPERPRRLRPDDEYDRPRRASNGGVWAVLAVTLFTVGGCVAGCLGVTVYAYNPKMHPFTSAEGKFRVEFPGDGAATATGGAADTLTVTAHRAQANEKYTVKRFALPAKLRGLPVEDALTEVAKKELQGEGASPDGPETRREVTRHDDLPAVDMRATAGKGLLNRRVTIVRCILAGQTVYVVSAQGPSVEEPVWWVRRYFTSFELTDPPKKGGEPPPKKGE